MLHIPLPGPKANWKDALASALSVIWGFLLMAFGQFLSHVAWVFSTALRSTPYRGAAGQDYPGISPSTVIAFAFTLLGIVCVVAASGIYFARRWGYWTGAMVFGIFGLIFLGDRSVGVVPLSICIYCVWRLLKKDGTGT